MIKLLCKNCSKEYEVKPYRRSIAKYCSRFCTFTSEERNRLTSERLKGRNINPQTTFKKGHIQPEEVRLKMRGKRPNVIPWNKKYDVFIDCKQCGIHIKIKPCHVGKRKFCSKTCADIFKDQGKTSEIVRLRMSKNYKIWRESVFARDNWSCQECKVRGGTLEAHHIKPFAWFPELRFAIDNGITLCKVCHHKTETFGGKGRRKIKIASA